MVYQSTIFGYATLSPQRPPERAIKTAREEEREALRQEISDAQADCEFRGNPAGH